MAGTVRVVLPTKTIEASAVIVLSPRENDLFAR